MYFVNKINSEYKEKLTIYVDMDGVITDYEVSKKLDFKNKRPIYTNINTLKELSKQSNIKLCILSICKKDYQIIEKNDWLDIYAPFFKKENRFILSKETYRDTKSADLKCNFLKNINKKEKIILIDDDNEILRYIKNNIKDIILFQDSSLID